MELVAGLREAGMEIAGVHLVAAVRPGRLGVPGRLGPVGEHLARMGLYDLEADETGTLHRRPTPVADRFRSWTTSDRFTR